MQVQAPLAQRLADAIAAGSYRPGEWLKQVDVATSFAASRFEVQRALEELKLRGVVTHFPLKGYRVSERTEGDVSKARQVRLILESAAIVSVVKNIDDKGIELLEQLSKEFWKAAESGTPTDRHQANHAFHDAVYSFAGNEVLSDLIRQMRDRARGTPIYSWPSAQSMYRSAKEHDDIVTALRNRNVTEAEEKVRLHIQNRE